MYERLLELWDRVADPEAVAGPRAELLTDATRAARDAGEFDRAIELVSAALEESDAADLTGRVERLMLRSHLVTDDLRTGAHADVQLAESLLAGVEDAAFRARMLGLVAIFRLNAGLDALPQAEEALAASLEVADDDGVASARARRTAPSSCRSAGTRRGSRSSFGPAAPPGSTPGPCCATGSTTPTRST